MPPNKQKASSTASVPDTPRRTGDSTAQTKSASKSSLLASTPARKRKASASVDESSPHKKAKATTNAHQRTLPSANAGDKPPEDDSDSVPFTVVCPANPVMKNAAAEDLYRDTAGEQFGLKVDYTIAPARWGDLSSYSVIKYQGLELRRGDFAYFANKLVPPEEIEEEETLASSNPLMYERENNFLAMVIDAKAEDTTKVYLRVMYAYWPEELPQRRQPYHGMKEVVMSNHVDILNAHSIVGKVDVARVDEHVETETVGSIYWRQTLDIGKLPRGRGKQPGVLSKLKGRCRCKQPTNPNKTVYICRHCTMWTHEHCLADDILKKAWEKHLKGSLGQDDEEDTLEVEKVDTIEVGSAEKKKTPILSSIASMASGILRGSAGPTLNAIADAPQTDGPADVKAKKTWSSKSTKSKIKDKARKPGDSAPWDGMLSATLVNEGNLLAHIVDELTGQRVWTTALSCLGCERRFN